MDAQWTFPEALVPATLKKRYKRFLADVEFEGGEEDTAHCPNTGSMKSCWEAGNRVWLLPSHNPKRKLKFTWELTETKNGYIGVNTVRPNQVTEWAIGNRLIPELDDFETLRREVKYGRENSRIDLLLEGPKGKTYVEIKNTTLLEGNQVRFPDAVTERGRKHLRELEALVEEGHRGVLLFFVNRPEGKTFSPADVIDEAYGHALRQASRNGVELLAYRVHASPKGFRWGAPVPIAL